jgi:hypothetical protein
MAGWDVSVASAMVSGIAVSPEAVVGMTVAVDELDGVAPVARGAESAELGDSEAQAVRTERPSSAATLRARLFLDPWFGCVR